MHQQSAEIEALIRIGGSIVAGAEPRECDLELIWRHDYINRQGPKSWRRRVAGLSDDEVAAFARGLTYVEAKFNWIGGSVAGVIWLFLELMHRNASMERLDELSSWILQNTKNQYNPFGGMSLGAKNYSEYLRLRWERDHRVNLGLKADNELEGAAQSERERRRRMAAAGAEARNLRIRAEIVEEMNTLPLADKLRRISVDPKYPPQFYPASIAGAATQQVVDLLPEETKLELARRLKGKRKGAWGSLRRRLLGSLGQAWNKKRWTYEAAENAAPEAKHLHESARDVFPAYLSG